MTQVIIQYIPIRHAELASRGRKIDEKLKGMLKQHVEMTAKLLRRPVLRIWIRYPNP
jgi:hypothetical protein